MSDGPASSHVSDVFWSAWRDGRLLLQRCESCAATQFYPRILCATCGTLSPSWVEASGCGTIYSFTIVRRAPSAAFAQRVPYAIALIDLDEGPRLMANLICDDFDALRCGAKVVLNRTRGDESRAFSFALA